ncbi:MAG: aminopeptidase [Clostridia bacterium]
MDERLVKLAKNIVDQSLMITSKEGLYVSIRGEDQKPLGDAVKDYAESKGIFVTYKYQSIQEYFDFWDNATPEMVEKLIKEESALMAQPCEAVFLARDSQLKNFPDAQKKLLDHYFHEVHQNIRLKKRWCLTIVPTVREAESKNLNYHDMLNTYLNACAIDYSILDKAMDNLVKYMNKADKVKIKAHGTNLEFSIKGLPAIKCIGKRNLPDGELYTAPVKNSVNGYITYNIPSYENGIIFKNVFLEFENGKIINATSNHTKEMNKLFDTDEGARFVGEFSFGLNPLIKSPQNSILYDEKISGSIHFTPGDSYERCDNGNHSALHWDLVQIQTPEYGGGEIWFDDILIRRNGLFVPKDLEILNPKSLLKTMGIITEEKNETSKKYNEYVSNR